MKSYRHVRLQLTFSSGEPVYQQIKAHIISEIKRGRLLPGAVLPGTRMLAQQLKVNRNTVILAYEQLAADGWIVTQYKSGTRISDTFPGNGQTTATNDATTTIPFRKFDFQFMQAPPLSLNDIAFDDGLPDLQLTPIKDVARECRRLLQENTNSQLFMHYSERGHEKLLEEINRMLNNDRGLAIAPGEICVARDNQMALYLVAQTLLFPGDHVAVEHPGYQPAWHTFEKAGAVLHHVPVHHDGIDMEWLETLCQQVKLKAVYVTPQHQYPTTVTMSAAKRQHLLALSNQYGFMIIEDDYDYGYHFDQQPLLPLAAMPHRNNIVYIGALFPGIPVGFVCGPAPFISSLAACRSMINRYGDTVLEQAVAHMMIAGDLRRHLFQTKYIYQKRLDLTASIVQSLFGEMATFHKPDGGLAIWLEPHKEVSITKIRSSGVNVIGPDQYYQHGFEGKMGLRLGYASIEDATIIKGLGKLARALQTV
jgi:GntR family transcriptional regulator / MocR family aminotransferase